MFKLIVALLIAQATAFMAPRTARANAVKLSMGVKDMVGVSLPLFGVFDPLGLGNCDDKTLSKYREAELKHGRVAMLAVLGVLTQDRFHPVYNGLNSANPLKAIEGVPAGGWAQIFVAIGVLEFCFGQISKEPGYTAGDYFGINGRIMDPKDSTWQSMQMRELANGRLAMFAIMGELAHAQISGLGPFEQLHSVGMIP